MSDHFALRAKNERRLVHVEDAQGILHTTQEPDQTRPLSPVDGRLMGARRRQEAQQSVPTLVVRALHDAIQAGITAHYVLFDRWFTTGKLVAEIVRTSGLDVISMVKLTTKSCGCMASGRPSKPSLRSPKVSSAFLGNIRNGRMKGVWLTSPWSVSGTSD